MAYFTPSCRGASLLTGNLQLIIPFQKRVPVGMSTESLPISSFHSSSFTAPFFLGQRIFLVGKLSFKRIA